MRRGEVWWGNPPTTGEARKRRPFLVVSDDAFNSNDRYPKVMVVHLASVRRAGGPYDWEVDLPRGAASLPRPSVAKCAEVYTFWKADLAAPQGTLSGEAMRKIDRALAVALSLRLAEDATQVG